MKLLKHYGIGATILFVVSILNSNGFAGTAAYLMEYDGAYAKLDMGNNQLSAIKRIEGTSYVSTTEKNIIADKTSNLLFIVNGREGREAQRIKVYDLKTLQFKKDLGIVSEDPDNDFPNIYCPPIYDKFFISWWDKSKAVSTGKGEVDSVFDKATLSKISDSMVILKNHGGMEFSNDGSKIYGVDFRTPYSIRVYDIATLDLLSTIPIDTIFSSLGTSKIVKDFKNEIFLFDENSKVQVSDPLNTDILHLFSVRENKKLQTIDLGFKGDSKLTPDGKKVIVKEVKYIYEASTVVKEIKPVGKIHIYDVVTGREVGLISDFFGNLKAVSPDSTKAYFIVNPITAADSYKLVVFDLSTYSKIAEIPTTVTSYMVFYEE